MYLSFLLFCPQAYLATWLLCMYHIFHFCQFNNHDNLKKEKKDSFDITSSMIFINHQIPPVYKFSLVKSCPTLCNPMDLKVFRLLCPWDSSGKNTGVGCRFFLQRIFPIQRVNPYLLRCRRIFTTEPPGKPISSPYHPVNK